MRSIGFAVCLSVAASVFADTSSVQLLPPPPRDSVRALKITRGKPVPTGLVFYCGRYLTPPYVVERYGTALRVNGYQVTGQIVPWTEFLQTQKATNDAPAAVAAPAEPAADEDPLADFFGTAEPKKKEKPAAKPEAKSAADSFEMNVEAEALLARVNAERTKLDANLRQGWVYAFGTDYSPISADVREADRLVMGLPGLLRKHTDYESFAAAVREADFHYFSEAALRDFHRARLGYPQLAERRKQLIDSRRARKNGKTEDK